ncbi:MAG: SpoIID/LytB domain-containing protein [Actinomycetota bacterium]|nr:SpoIID/LytB domain-containing protein [Actinomycetota bacterium]
MRVTRVLAVSCCLALAGALFAPPAAAKPKKPTSGVAPVSLVAHGNNQIALAGLHSFLDTVKLQNAGDGLVVVNRLPLERYVLGLNEVPPEWPLHALRAQAVAARTYALWTLLRPPVGDAATYGFDICASTDCQVFSGADVLNLSNGHRWVQAVRDTAGEAVLYRGQPILARYHSTSGGRTFDNEDVFYDEPSYPYLQGVPSPHEQGAPLLNWKVSFPLEHVQALLERAGWWGPQHGRLVTARTLPPPSRTGLPYPDIRFKGTKGSLVRLGDDFRTVARDNAPSMFPGVYPSQGPTGPLPETLPSERFKVVTQGKVIHFFGRGWGHGTGMSQWGAHGMAQLGSSYVDILKYYYRNTTVGPIPYRGPIDVGVSWAQSSVSATGSFSIVDGTGKTIVRNALGTWGFNFTGGDTVAIEPGAVGPPPDDFEPRKRVPTGAPSISVDILEAPKTIVAGEAAPLTIDLSHPARVSTLTSGGSKFSDLNVELKDRGKGRISWVAPLQPGRYKVRVEAVSDRAAGRSKAIEIAVEPLSSKRGKGADSPKALGETEETSASLPLRLTALVLLLIVGSAGITGTIGMWPKRPSSKNK